MSFLRIGILDLWHYFLDETIFTKIKVMKVFSIEPFIPSGADFQSSKKLFLELGFTINWDAGEYIGFQKDECRFILQKFNNKEFAENFMLSIKIDNVDEFRNEVLTKKLPEKYGIRIGNVTDQSYGREVSIIDIAGVCWHFVQY